ncbi:hypothetical protein BJX70DRAFT_393435 [Aspergillus crustosus]
MKQLATRPENASEDNLEAHIAVLQDLFSGKTHSREAAAKLASAALALDGSLETQLGLLWHLILRIAREKPEHHDKVVDILVDMSHLPDVAIPNGDGQGDEPLTLHDMVVWRDLPLLGWEIRRHWDYSIPPPGTKTPTEREAAIARMVNVNHFVAFLVATDEPVFLAHWWFALVTLREALETPWAHMRADEPLEAWIPAAAAWIEVLGAEIYEWDEVYESGPLVGAKGRGGPLWKASTASEDELEHVRRIAGEAEVIMREIEDGNVE